ncbi:MAG: DNA adenine methylase [Treponema sp.]|jgi:adenine-specific DNA-methyltransferase|nr:DNA adenine methylase [Treponema sp.]
MMETMSVQPGLFPCENKDYLTKQIITYIGNKRSLMKFIERGVYLVQKKLGKSKLTVFDVFSGSGVVARRFKQYASRLLVNDMERYAALINSCYLTNASDINMSFLKKSHHDIISAVTNNPLKEGVVTKLYAPVDDNDIRRNERVFYTRRNAMYIDTARSAIEQVDEPFKKFFLAPLLSEASIHANTPGVFKGFYKNRATGIGQFGGSKQNALTRIKGDITLPFPVFSNFDCEIVIYNGNANNVVKSAPEVDLAYLDPPYNQHPYGSNYFMLNVILDNKQPAAVSKVSGIPHDWNRSAYNKKREAPKALLDLISGINAKYVMISFNSEGFISLEEMTALLEKNGKLEILETKYNTFRGCRNLAGRNVHVKEYLYLLEK